jgi:gamma-glutamylcyclotransferase (GGCT)/AIG2-like uncharacterized protein YtfP
MNLFVYGTLMNDALVVEVTGRRLAKEPAALQGYRKVQPADGYPYITPEAGGVVDGFLLRGLDAAALRALDRYEDEGQLYRRIEVVVTVGDDPVPAMAYVGMQA